MKDALKRKQKDLIIESETKGPNGRKRRSEVEEEGRIHTREREREEEEEEVYLCIFLTLALQWHRCIQIRLVWWLVSRGEIRSRRSRISCRSRGVVCAVLLLACTCLFHLPLQKKSLSLLLLLQIERIVLPVCEAARASEEADADDEERHDEAEDKHGHGDGHDEGEHREGLHERIVALVSLHIHPRLRTRRLAVAEHGLVHTLLVLRAEVHIACERVLFPTHLVLPEGAPQELDAECGICCRGGASFANIQCTTAEIGAVACECACAHSHTPQHIA